MESLVSIIMPAYNAGRYLAEAAESVMSQSHSAWELIIVDDGSADDTGAIARGLAAADARIRFARQENAGPSAARNRALDMARGEWITFLDADDKLLPGSLGMLLELAEQAQADIAIAALTHTPGLSAAADNHPQAEVLEPEEAALLTLYQRRGMNSSCSAKLFAAHLWQKRRFREGIHFEDLDIICPLLLGARRVAVSAAPAYYYRENPASFIHTFSRSRADSLDVTERIAATIGRLSPELARAASDRRLSAAFNVYTLIAANPTPAAADAEFYRATALRCEKIIRESRMLSLRNSRVRSRNRLAALASILGGFRLLRFLARRQKL